MVNHPRGSTRKQRPGRSLIRDKDRNTPVPPILNSIQKLDKEKEPEEVPSEKKIIPEEEKKPIVVASPVEEELPKSVKKKNEPEEQISGPESDVNIEAESTAESSSSEKSQKPDSRFTPVPNRSKAITKSKDEPKKKCHDKKKQENASSSSSSSTSSQSSTGVAPMIKKEKCKDDESTKTRSKSKEDTKSKEPRESRESRESKETRDSRETRETRETSRDPEKTRGNSTKPRRMTDDDFKKQQRGRKKREDSDKSRDKDDNSGTESSAPCYKGPIQLGDRLKVYYGPTHESKVTYEAKVIGIQRIDEGAELDYLVHYTGWNTRYDEWIKATRIAQNFTQTQGRIKRTKATPRPQTPSASSAKGSKTPNLQTGRRRAQSVAPSGTKNSSSGSSTGGLSSSSGNGKDKDKEATRSTTPLSVASSSSRTKSPATPASRPTRNAARNAELGIELRTRRTRRMSGHTDLSVATESEDSDAYETDNTEPERARTRSRGTEERRRREVRRRVEDRIKPDENSEVDDDKDPSEELPRRTRRLRKAVKKIQDTKSEEAESGSGLFADETDEAEENEEDNDHDNDNDNDNDNDEEDVEESELISEFEKPSTSDETPKGRDFDLNQIRSELKGFDKAVKLEVMRMEPEHSGDEEVEVKVEVFEEIKEEEMKKEEVIEVKQVEEIVKIVKPPASPSPTTEDVYEFKEPEPFEFEVRNKRDSGGDKDKIGLKKRVFDEEPKSPKKKQKTSPPVAVKEIKLEPVVIASASGSAGSGSGSGCGEIELKKKPKRSPVIKRSDDIDIETSVIKSVSKEFDKSVDAKVISISSSVSSYLPEDSKSTVNSDILFSDIPGVEEIADADDCEDRLVILESEITEVDEKPIISCTPSPYTLVENDKVEVMKKEEKKVELPLMINEKEEKVQIPGNLPSSTIIVSTCSTISNTTLSATSAIERRILEAKIPSVVSLIPSTPLVPAPISARLPATSTIEEKLSAAALAFRQQKPKDTKREDEEKRKESVKKIEIKRGKILNESMDGHCSKVRIDDKKKDFLVPEEDILKEEELEQVKIRKEEMKKNDVKLIDHRRCLDKRQIDPLKEISESTQLEKQKRKKILSQEFLDSTDSSDSEQKLVIDNPDEKCDKIIKMEKPDVESSDRNYLEQKSISSAVVVKHEEEGENMNLLCEEEIPGSPAPAMEVLEPEESTERDPGKDKLDKKIVILEMPFASAPTSGAQSTSQGSGLTMTVASSCGVQGAMGHGVLRPMAPVQVQVVQGLQALQGLQVIQNRRESNEAAPVMDNTPPTTPDSTISNVSGSPRDEEGPGGSPMSEDTKSREEGESEEGKGFNEGLEEALGGNDSSLGDNDGKGGLKRSVEEPGTPKKRKRNRKNSECGKEKKNLRVSGRTTRQGAASDSDDTSEGSNAGGHLGSDGGLNGLGETLGRDHKSLKYNFFVDLDPELDGCQRIAVLQHKLSELKKTYNIVKTELAAIERRRKKLRRREREGK